jgi:PAS domain S-box-containing protein
MAWRKTHATSYEKLIAGVDWSNSPLGDPSTWPRELSLTFSTVLGSPSQIVLFWGPEYIALYNEAYAPTIGNRHPRAFGRPAVENWSELWDDLRPLLDRVRQNGEHVFARDRPFYMERHGYPELVTFDIAYSAVLDASGRVAGVLCIVNETSDRTKFEHQLRESEQRFRNMADNAPVMLWVTNEHGLCTYLNKTWYAVTGQTLEEAEGLGWLEATHPEDRENAERVFLEANARKAPFRLEYRLRQADGSYRWSIDAAHPRLSDDGSFLGYIGSVIDIHEIKLAEINRSAIINLQEQFRTLSEPADIAYASAEILGRLLNVSRAGYGVVKPRNETITIERDWNAAGITSLAGTLQFRDYGSYIENLKRGETVIIHDADTDPRTASTAGALKEISAQSFINMPITEENGLVALLYLNHRTARVWTDDEIELIRDIAERTRQAAERRRAENELRALTISLETQVNERTAALLKSEEQLRQAQKMEAVGQLTGGIAHDFNNMLAVIIGGLGLIQRRIERGQTDVQTLIEGAVESAHKAATLTQRLLAFSRQQPLDPKPIDANSLVANMREMLFRTLGEHIQIESVLSAGLWRARVDPAQLESAILNLAINSRDAMTDGGKLTIETGNAHIDDHYARDHDVEMGQYVMIAVSDTGTGMSPDIASRAFEPFFTTKPVGKGTGLGLSQIFGFVRQSGGHIKIYSEVGVGTTVKLYIPRYRGDATAFEVPPKDEFATAMGEIVLLVEDRDDVRTYASEALKELGYTVVTAGGGSEALRRLQDGLRPDLLLTDIVMPELNGRQLADSALKILPSLKVLYMTGYTRNAVVHNGMLDPGTNFIQKPFTIDQLGAKVRTVIDKDDSA